MKKQLDIESLRDTFIERGISPVVGVILMVAITVVLAAVLATFVLGLGNGLSDRASAGVSVTETQSSVAVHLVSSGTAEQVHVLADGQLVKTLDSSAVGHQIYIKGLDADSSITVLAEADGQNTTIAQHAVQSRTVVAENESIHLAQFELGSGYMPGTQPENVYVDWDTKTPSYTIDEGTYQTTSGWRAINGTSLLLNATDGDDQIDFNISAMEDKPSRITMKIAVKANESNPYGIGSDGYLAFDDGSDANIGAENNTAFIQTKNENSGGNRTNLTAYETYTLEYTDLDYGNDTYDATVYDEDGNIVQQTTDADMTSLAGYGHFDRIRLYAYDGYIIVDDIRYDP